MLISLFCAWNYSLVAPCHYLSSRSSFICVLLSPEPAPSASFTRTMASYINISLTRTVNCLLTKQKSYWQQPRCGCGAERMTKRAHNVQPLCFGHLQVSLQGPICRMHLMLTPTLDSTVCLSTTKQRIEGIRKNLALSLSLVHSPFHVLSRSLRCSFLPLSPSSATSYSPSSAS